VGGDAARNDSDVSADAGREEALACIESWPVEVTAPRLPSANTMPIVRWTTTIAGGPLRGSIEVSATRIAVAADNIMELLDTQGAHVRSVVEQFSQTFSAPAADVDENFYFSDQSVSYSVDKDGIERWRHPFDPPIVRAEFVSLGRPLVGPNGVVYTTGIDGNLWGLDKTTGSPVLKTAVGLGPPLGAVEIALGAGDSIFATESVESSQNLWRLHAIRMDGSSAGYLIDPSGWRATWALAGPRIGIVGAAYTRPIDGRTKTEVFDRCGKYLWTVPGDANLPLLIGPRDELLVFEPQQLSGPRVSFSLRWFSADGLLLVGPVTIPLFATVALGSDETLYVVACGAPSPTIIALSDQLMELWRLPIAGECPKDAALGDDGALYLSRRVSLNSNEVVAVRTTSPGPSKASWPRTAFRPYWLGYPP
jgi:outer membrane protein assembly factor BamB